MAGFGIPVLLLLLGHVAAQQTIISYQDYYLTDADRPNICRIAFQARNHRLHRKLQQQQQQQQQHSRRHPSASSRLPEGQYVPFIGTSIVRDSQLLVMRLFYSIDYPVKHFVVVASQAARNSHRALGYELKHLQEYAANVVLITCDAVPSCAEGWNAVFQAFPQEPWGVYAARDTAWEPGSLAKLAAHMWNASRSGTGDSVELGLMKWSNMPANSGGEYNAFAMTRAGISRFGLFDESIYPANFEDRDMELRAARMKPPLSMKTFTDVAMVHGNPREFAYKSGLWLPDDPNNANETQLTQLTGSRFLVNGNYLYRKWGCQGERKQRFAPFSSCAYQTPFNKSVPVWYWQASKQQRKRDLLLQVRRDGPQPGLFDTQAGRMVFHFPDNYAGWKGYTETSGMCRLTGVLGVVNQTQFGQFLQQHSQQKHTCGCTRTFARKLQKDRRLLRPKLGVVDDETAATTAAGTTICI